MKTLSSFTKQFSISKTLRFALEPVGKTREHISEFIHKDNQIDDNYEKAKKIIDDYHRHFIEVVLSSVSFVTKDYLEVAYQAYQEAPDTFEKLQKDFCKKIGDEFLEANKAYLAYDKYGELFKSLGNRNDSPFTSWLKENNSEEAYNEKLQILSSFKLFATYFVGFNENRKNVYSNENKHGSVGFRIYQNLVRFFDNCNLYEQHKEILSELLSDYSDMFDIAHFEKCISQSQIDVYNQKIGSQSEQNTANKGVNQLINEYRQKTGKKIPFMKELYKQVLSLNDSTFKIDAFTSDEECIETIRAWWNQASQYFVEAINANNLTGIDYIKETALSDISHNIYADWSFIRNAFDKDYDKIVKNKAISISELDTQLKTYISSNDLDIEYQSTLEYFKTGCAKLLNEINQAYQDNRDVLEASSIHKGKNRETDFEKIKKFLDTVLDFVRFTDPLFLVHEFKKIDGIPITSFYSEFEKIYDEKLKSILALYNKVRNYATKKPYSTEKIKLNFDNSQLLNGWDLNKEKDCSGVLFIKDGNYYVGIINKKHNNIFNYKLSDNDKSASKKQKKLDLQKQCLATDSDDNYQKVIYKLVPDPAKMLPKVFFSKKGTLTYKTSAELITINADKSFKTDKSALSKIIAYYQDCIAKHEWSNFFNFKFKKPSEYSSYQEFLADVESSAYTISVEDKIKSSYINSLVDEGKLFLFKIHSKDFSEYSKGKPNLHTMYWKAIFEEENLKDLVVKLNGNAEIFFREPSIKEKSDIIVHNANQPIKNKNPLNPKQKSTFSYDLIKDKRYTKERFLFHCPLTLNARCQDPYRFNSRVNEFLKDNKDINIIGIDRGERHLLYYSIINQKGEIIEQGSFNTLVSDNNHKVDYNALLTERSKKRKNERKSWKAVEGIKDLKTGYLSHIVYKLAVLMIKHNAVIALEDLNLGFKNSRKRFEKSVYQNFEKALIEKLNYLVFKDKAPTEAGGYLNAYQLTSKFESFQNLYSQTGFLFYVPADNTSKIDPITGFINTLRPKYENVTTSQSFFSDFQEIKYNKQKDYFEFSYDIKKNQSAKNTLPKRTKWTLCTHKKDRYYVRIDKKTSEPITEKADVTENLKSLFAEYNISYQNGNDIKNDIVKISEKSFWTALIWNLKILLQMRYTYKESNGEEIDFILSPVADRNGKFFDSRIPDQYSIVVPQDADANGAYNIARKCLYYIQNISDDFKLPKKMSKVEWMNYTQRNV